MPPLIRPWYDPLPAGVTVTYEDTVTGRLYTIAGYGSSYSLEQLVEYYVAGLDFPSTPNITNQKFNLVGGEGPPTSLYGKEDDVYFDVTNSQFYGPKTPMGWGSPIPVGDVSQADLNVKANKDVIVYHFKDHGGVADYANGAGTDNGPALQALIDLANANFVSGRAGAPVIDLGFGSYAFSTPVTLKSPIIRGTHIMSGTKIFWVGSSGATVFTKSSSFGGSSYGAIRDVTFSCYPQSGVLAFDFQHEPACWLDLTATPLDKGFFLDQVGFIGGVDAVKVSSVVNGHWRNLRFDGLAGYAIRFTPASSQFLGSFELTDFTYDNHRASGATNGINSSGPFLIDNSAGATNLGTFSFRNGRVEFNTPNTADVNALVKVISSSARAVGLHLGDLAVQGVGGNTLGSYIYWNAPSSTPLPSIMLTNVRGSGVSKILDGNNLPTQQAIPVWRGNIGYLSLGQGSPNTVDSPGDAILSSLRRYVYSGATQPIDSLRAGTDAYDRWQMKSDGSMLFGSGSADLDTTLSRTGSGQLSINGTPLGGGGGSPGLYAITATPTALSNSTTETVLCTYTVPAGSLSVGRVYKVTASGTYDAIVNGGTLALYLRLGGLTGANWSAFTWAQSATASTARPWSLTATFTVRTIGSSGTISGGGLALGGFGTGVPVASVSTLNPASTVNTSNALDLVLDGKWSTADAGNVLRVEQFIVELVKS